jgi:Tfp pilus assembly protein PilN
MAIKVNLLPREDRPKRAGIAPSIGRPSVGGAAGMAVWVALAVLVLAVLYVGGSFYFALSERDSLRKEVARLREEDKDLKSRLTELELVRAAKREIERRIDIIGKVAKSQKVPLSMMNGVLTAVPQGVWLQSFDMKPQEVQRQVEAQRPPISYSSDTIKALEEKKQEAATAGAKKPDLRTVTELAGFAVTIKGIAFNNQQVADFMDNLRKAGFGDVDFTVTQATTVEQVRVTSFELTANVKL